MNRFWFNPWDVAELSPEERRAKMIMCGIALGICLPLFAIEFPIFDFLHIQAIVAVGMLFAFAPAVLLAPSVCRLFAPALMKEADQKFADRMAARKQRRTEKRAE